MAKMLSAWATEVLGLTPDTTKTCEFTDVENQTQEMKDYIVEACQLGLMWVWISEFRPNDKVTRAEFGTVLSRALRGDKNDGGTPYYADHLAALKDAGVMNDISNPSSFEVRGYVWLMMQRADEEGIALPATCKDPMVAIACALNQEDAACPVECRDTNPEEDVVKDGTLNVSLNSDTPDNGTSIPNVGISTFASLDVEANATVKINSFDIEKVGLWSRATVKKVWFEHNWVRVSSKATLWSDSKTTISFSPAFEVKSAEKLELVAELSGWTSEEFAFKFTNSDTTAEDVNMNLTTPTLKTATYTVAKMNVVPFTNTGTYNAWDNTNLELGKFTLENQNNDERKVTVKAITFRNNGDGDMDANLTKLALYKNWDKISTEYTINSKDITFVVDNLEMIANQSQTLYIRWDAKGVDKAAWDTYKFTLRYAEDLNSVESSTLFRTNVLNDGSTFSSIDLATYIVKWGNITFTKDDNLSSTQTVSPASNGVVVLKWTITVKEPVRFENLNLTGTLWAKVTKVTLKIGSSTATYTPTTTGVQLMDFYGTRQIDKTSTVQILVDVKSDATNWDIKFADLDISKFWTVEYISNSYNAKDQWVGTISSSTLTVKSTTVTASRTDGLSDRNVVQWSNNLTLFIGKLASTTSIQTTVDAFSFVWNNVKYNNLLSTTLYVNWTAIKSATFKNWQVDFSSLNIKVKNGTDAEVKLVGSLTTSTTLASEALTLTLTGYSAYDENSKTVSINEVSAAKVTVKDAWSVELASNSSAAQTSLYTAGSSNVELGRIDVKAQDDLIKLTDMYLKNAASWSVLELANRTNSPKLFSLDNWTETLVANGSLIWTTLVFENLDSANFKVAAWSTKTLVVRANINAVLNTWDLLNNNVKIDFDASYSAKAWTISWARFVSDSNGNTLTTVTENYTANQHVVVRWAPELALANTTTTNSRLMNLNVKTNWNEIRLKSLKTYISSITLDSWSVLTINVYKDTVSWSPIAVGSITATSGGFNGTTSRQVDVNFTDTNWYVVSAGNTANLLLEVVWYNPYVNGSYAYAREFKVTDMSYNDVFQNGYNFVNTIASFTNVWTLPLVTSYKQ